MRLKTFLNLTAAVPETAVRRALTVALSVERPTSPEGGLRPLLPSDAGRPLRHRVRRVRLGLETADTGRCVRISHTERPRDPWQNCMP
jgi:hypothetical protein